MLPEVPANEGLLHRTLAGVLPTVTISRKVSAHGDLIQPSPPQCESLLKCEGEKRLPGFAYIS